MEPEFLSRYREYIASQPCKTGGRCRNEWCLYFHTEKHSEHLPNLVSNAPVDGHVASSPMQG